METVPMETRGDSPLALREAEMEIGVPTSLIMEPSSEQTCNKVEQFSSAGYRPLHLLEKLILWAKISKKYNRIVTASNLF